MKPSVNGTQRGGYGSVFGRLLRSAAALSPHKAGPESPRVDDVTQQAEAETHGGERRGAGEAPTSPRCQNRADRDGSGRGFTVVNLVFKKWTDSMLIWNNNSIN